MTQRDQFLRQATAPLRRTPTRPVGAGDPAALVAQLVDALGRAGGLIAGTSDAIATLHDACRRAKAPPPGVPEAGPARALSPQEERVAGYLAGQLASDVALRRRVQVAVYRHFGAREAIAAAEAAREEGKLDLALIERLRQSLYHLSVYHMEFQDDPLLRQLFPAPRTHGPDGAGDGSLTAIQRLKRKLAQEAALEGAKALHDGLDEPMKLIGLVIEMAEGTRRMGLQDLLVPATRQARLVAVQLGQDPQAVARLKQARKDFAALHQALMKIRNAEDTPLVEKAAFPLSGFEAACKEHPSLRLLWTARGA